MSFSARSLTLIVAATRDHGIGQNGSLPWPSLKSEMAYFARVTQRAPISLPQGTKNAVVMGRKTWDSIPEKFRPLKGRVNYVVSKTLRETGRESSASASTQNKSSVVKVLGSLDEVIESLNLPKRHQTVEGNAPPASPSAPEGDGIGHIFIIGGGTIYASALKLQQTRRILLTKILQPNFECDTFFPLDLDSDDAKKDGWQRKGTEELEAFIGETFGNLGTVRVEGDVEYEFCLYEKADNV